jgi:RNA polymerase sigma factor for flagellar operon FliA
MESLPRASISIAPPAETFLPLVDAIARRLSRRLPPTVEMSELVNDGVIGLIRALGRYDPARGIGFASYAQHRIRGAMLDGLRARDPLPRTVRRVQKSLDADPGSVAPHPGIQIVDLDCALGVPADEATSPEEAAVEADLRRRVLDGVALLPPRDRQVLLWRYVLGRTLRETSEHVALSATRTIEIQERALERLRRYLNGQPMLLDRRRRSARASPLAGTTAGQEAGRPAAKRPGTPRGEGSSESSLAPSVRHLPARDSP